MNERATATVHHPHERELDSWMLAIVQSEYGSADVLRVAEIERPAIVDDESWSASAPPGLTAAPGFDARHHRQREHRRPVRA